MGKSFNKCHDKKFDCHCHKKCDCNDKQKKPDKKFVQDCICSEWSIPAGSTGLEQSIFVSGGFEQSFSSGFISYDCGHSPFITVQFYNNSTPVGPSLVVFEDSSISFTRTRFNRITVTCPPITGNVSNHVDDECSDICEGEICIKTRYPLNEH